jgi:hypothetical protein
LHIAFGRTRIGAINDADRNYKYVSALREYVTSDSICLCLSDGSLLGPLAAQLGAKKVYCIDGNTLTQHVVQDYIKHNNLQDKLVVLSSVHDLVALLETHDKVLCYRTITNIKQILHIIRPAQMGWPRSNMPYSHSESTQLNPVYRQAFLSFVMAFLSSFRHAGIVP